MHKLVIKTRRFVMAVVVAAISLTSVGWSTPVQAQALPTNGILFHSNMDGDNDIYLANSTGTTLTKLTKNSTEEINAAWSPDGKYIVYESYVIHQTRPQLYIMEMATGTIRQLINDPTAEYSQAVFSPDGTKIAFRTKDDTNSTSCLRLYELKIQQQTTLKCSAVREAYELPTWSPDGQEIMFTSIFGEFNRFAINIHNLSVRLVVPGAYTGVWSPDGQYIAFSAVRHKPTDTEQVFVMRVDGSDVRQITSDPTRSRRAVAWSPANRILIATFDAPDFFPDLRTIQSDGTQEVALISTPAIPDYAGPGAMR